MGTARIRFTVSSLHTDDQIDQLLNVAQKVWDKISQIK
jgi:7-keto-8-aminopelargonate synthetase-like enzyme